MLSLSSRAFIPFTEALLTQPAKWAPLEDLYDHKSYSHANKIKLTITITNLELQTPYYEGSNLEPVGLCVLDSELTI